MTFFIWCLIGFFTSGVVIFLAQYFEEQTTLTDIFAMILLGVMGPIFSVMVIIWAINTFGTKIIIFNGKKGK